MTLLTNFLVILLGIFLILSFIFQFSYKLSCTHFLYNLTLCTLIVIVMVYWFKLVALIYPPAPAQSLTVTPSVVEWVKFSRNLQQITLLRPCTLHCTTLLLRADLFVSRCIISSQMCTVVEEIIFKFHTNMSIQGQ